MKNRYLKNAHFSEAKFRVILRCFCEDLTASQTANLTKISRNTINRVFNLLRQRILTWSLNKDQEQGVFELDESYFRAKRVRGKRERGAAGKTIVFGLLKREGHVYIEVVKNVTKKELMPIIQGKILEGSTVHTDGWKAYNGLIINGYDHFRVYHSKDEFFRGKSHINGIESFWSYAKSRLSKFKGSSDDKFILHLKECEFRFNYRHENLYLLILRKLRQNPL